MGSRGSDVAIEGITPETTLLVAGPPMTGKYRLMLRLLADHTERVVLITTKNGADRVVDDFRGIAGDVPEDAIGVIDCISHQQAIEEVRDTDRIKYVNSPQNLTSVGVKFTQLFETIHGGDSETPTGVGLHSLSQLLMHSDMKRVYRFLQVLTGQIRSAGWMGIAVTDTTTAGEEQLQMLQHHFDGIVETRENDAGEREYRVRGLRPTASDWTPF